MTSIATVERVTLATIALIISALVALSAGPISHMLQKQREHEQWLRDRRFGLYPSMATASSEMSHATTMLGAVYLSPEFSAEPKIANHANGNWDAAHKIYTDLTFKIILMARPKLRTHVIEMNHNSFEFTEAVSEVRDLFRQHPADDDARAAALDRLELAEATAIKLRDQFLGLAIGELDAHVSPWWERGKQS